MPYKVTRVFDRVLYQDDTHTAVVTIVNNECSTIALYPKYPETDWDALRGEVSKYFGVRYTKKTIKRALRSSKDSHLKHFVKQSQHYTSPELIKKDQEKIKAIRTIIDDWVSH